MNLIMKKYERLTKYIDEFSCGNSFGEMVIDTKHKGTKDDPKHFPYVKYETTIINFLHDFYDGNYAIEDYLDKGKKISKSIKSGRGINSLSEKELLIYLDITERQVHSIRQNKSSQYGDEVHSIRYTSPLKFKFIIIIIYKWRSLVLF